MNRDIKFRFWQTAEMYMLNWDEINQSSLYELLTAIDSVPMQFVGLTDRNGKEIYEGDIVKCYRSGSHLKGDIYFIKYSEQSFIMAQHQDDVKFDCLWFFDFEVIGNIYENPELIINL